MRTPNLLAIKCSERMPTREDADKHGRIVALYIEQNPADSSLRTIEWSRMQLADYWFPLNHSAIATDENP